MIVHDDALRLVIVPRAGVGDLGGREVELRLAQFDDRARGIVSTARTNDPDSATTSFFLMLGPAPHLDSQYAAFGRIVQGIEVLDAFEKEEVDGETPKRRLEILDASIEMP